jgi:hypothetical protein
MCLTRITEIYERPSTLIVTGWKTFSGSGNGNTVRLGFAINGSNYLPLDKWIQATAEHRLMLNAGDGKLYQPGFHAYAEEHELSSQSYRAVFLRKVTCRGEQSGMATIVAQEMFVPSAPNRWPPKPGEA